MGAYLYRVGVVMAVVGTLGAAGVAPAASIFDFRYGTMTSGGAAIGTIPTWTLLFHFADEPPDQTNAAWVEKLFGPAYPNVSDYFWTQSGHLLRFTNGAVIGPASPVDDPDTVLREDLRWDSENLTNPRILYFGMRTRTGRYISALGNGGGGVDAHGLSLGSRENFALVAASTRDGELYSGDVVAIKTGGGYFLRTFGVAVLAEGVGYAATDRRFVVTKVSGAPGPQIYNGDVFALRSLSTSKYVRAIGGGGGSVVVDLDAPSVDSHFTLEKHARDDIRLTRQVFDRLVASGVDFAARDLNRDGVVTGNEFRLWVVEMQTARAEWGQMRNPAGRFRPTGATVDVDCLQSYVGEDWYRHTLAHEMMHQFGAIDLYGHDSSRSAALTLMSGEYDTLQYLDPWHRLRLGWLGARIYEMGGTPFTQVLRMPESQIPSVLSERSPVLLYDPARYDVASRSGEFFMVEFRNQVSPVARYDRGGVFASAPGLALWQVKTDAAGNLVQLPAEGGASGVDASCQHLAPPAYARGDRDLWTDAHGTIQPRYVDGAPANVKIRVAPSVQPAHEDILVCVTSGSAPDARCPPCIGRTAVERSSLRLDRLLGFAGDETLAWKGRFPVSLSEPLAPHVKGVRIVLEGKDSWSTNVPRAFLDVTVPSGAYDPVTGTGWTVNKSKTVWTYRSAANGISKVWIKWVPALGAVRFAVIAKNLTLDPEGPPFWASLILDPPYADNAQCGEAEIELETCVSTRNAMTCH